MNPNTVTYGQIKASGAKNLTQYMQMQSNQPSTPTQSKASGGSSSNSSASAAAGIVSKNTYDVKTQTYTDGSGNKFSMQQKDIPKGTVVINALTPSGGGSSGSSGGGSTATTTANASISSGVYDISTQTYTDNLGNKYSMAPNKVPENADIIKTSKDPITLSEESRSVIKEEPIYENVLDTDKYQDWINKRKTSFDEQTTKSVLLKSEQLKSRQDIERKRTLVKEKTIASTGYSDEFNKSLTKKRQTSYEIRQKRLGEQANKELEEDFEQRKTLFAKDIEAGRSSFVSRKQTGTKITTYEYQAPVVSQESGFYKYFSDKGKTISYIPDGSVMPSLTAAKQTETTSTVDLSDLLVKDKGLKDYTYADTKTFMPVDFEQREKSNYIAPVLGQPREVFDISDSAFKTQTELVFANKPNVIIDVAGMEIAKAGRSFLKDVFGVDLTKGKTLSKTSGGNEFALPDIQTDFSKGSLTSIEVKTNTVDFLGSKIPTLSATSQRDNNLFDNPIKNTVSTAYDATTSLAGGLAANMFSTRTTQSGYDYKSSYSLVLTGEIKAEQYKEQGFLNPKRMVLDEITSEVPKSIEDSYYLGKLGSETAGWFVLPTASMIGQASRAKNAEEMILPLAIGGAFRVVSPVLAKPASNLLAKANTGVENVLTKYLGSKAPVLASEIAPSIYNNLLTEDRVIKGLMVAGSAVEIGGLSFVPQEQKKEYIRQVGLMNAFVPAGYRIADTGLMLVDTAKVFAVASIGGTKIKPIKDFMDAVTYEKFIKTGGGTPISAVPETDQINLLRGIGENQKVSAMFDELGVDPLLYNTGAAYRSAYDSGYEILPKIGNYEGIGDFFAPVIHPIALGNVGLKARLLRKSPSMYDRYSLLSGKPSVEFTLAPRGTAVSFVGKNYTKTSYEQLKYLYGYSPVNKNIANYGSVSKIGKMNIDFSKTISDIEFGKTVSSRPFKNRDIRNLFGEDTFNTYFVDRSLVDVGTSSGRAIDLEGYFSSQSRAIGRTTESEIILNVPRTRVELAGSPLELNILGKKVTLLKDTRKFFRDRGYADYYIYHDLEVVPMNVYMTKTSAGNAMMLAPAVQQQKITAVRQLQASQQKQLTSGTDLEIKTTDLVNQTDLIKTSNKVFEEGGYTKEMKKLFGFRRFEQPFVPMILPLKDRESYSEPSSLKQITKSFAVKSKSTNIDLARYDGFYADRKTPVVYREANREPDRIIRDIYRTPDRTPDRLIDRLPDRVPDRLPERVPDRKITRIIIREDIRRTPPKRPRYDLGYQRIPTRVPEIRVPPRTPPNYFKYPSLFSMKGGLKTGFRREISSRKTKPIFQLKADLFRKFASAEKDIPVTEQTIKLRSDLWRRQGSFLAFIPTKDLLSKGFLTRIGLNSRKGLVL